MPNVPSSSPMDIDDGFLVASAALLLRGVHNFDLALRSPSPPPRSAVEDGSRRVSVNVGPCVSNLLKNADIFLLFCNCISSVLDVASDVDGVLLVVVDANDGGGGVVAADADAAAT